MHIVKGLNPSVQVRIVAGVNAIRVSDHQTKMPSLGILMTNPHIDENTKDNWAGQVKGRWHCLRCGRWVREPVERVCQKCTRQKAEEEA